MAKRTSLIAVSLAFVLGACTSQPATTPASSGATPTEPGLIETSLPASETPKTGATHREPCLVGSAGGLTAYKRPSTQAEIFGQVPDDNPLQVSGLTQDGWIGFDPGVAQAGNTGLFRLRWLPPSSGSLQGDCETLPTLPSLPANVCFTMAMGEEPIFSAASESAPVVGSLQVNAYASVVSRTPDDWLELDLAVSSMGLSRPGWIPAAAANFNGPCGRFGPVPDAVPITSLPPGSMIEFEEISMSDLDHGWAVGGLPNTDQHILRTVDGGKSWVDITPPEPNSGAGADPKQASAFFQAGGKAQVTYWYSDPTRAPLVLSLWVTNDWGSSWQSAGIRLFADLAEAPPLIDFVEDGNGLLLIRYFVGMGNHAYALLASSDGGQNYTTVLEPQDTVDTCQRNKLILFDAQYGWMTGACPFLVDEGALLEVTRDAGRTWDEVSLPTPPMTSGEAGVLYCEAVDPHPFSSEEGLLLVRCQGEGEKILESYLYSTDDGGQNWDIEAFPATAAYFLDRQHGWALGKDIFWSEDGGQTWQPRKSVIWEGDFNFLDAEHGWAIARSGTEVALVRTADGGATWSLIEPIIAAP